MLASAGQVTVPRVKRHRKECAGACVSLGPGCQHSPSNESVVGAFLPNAGLLRIGSTQSVYFQHELESLNHLSWQLFLKLEKGKNSSRC